MECSELWTCAEDAEMSMICEKVEDNELYNTSYDEELYNICEMTERCFNQKPENGGALKNAEDIKNKKVKVMELKSKEEFSRYFEHNEITDIMNYNICQVSVRSKDFVNHSLSNLHKNEFTFQNSLSNVYIKYGLEKKSMTCKISSKIPNLTFITLESFLDSIQNIIFTLITELISQYTVFKVYFILHTDVMQKSLNISHSYDFQTHNFKIGKKIELHNFFSTLLNAFSNKISSYEEKETPWALRHIKSIDMHVTKCDTQVTNTYLDLPKNIKYKKAIINVKNSDTLCFKWALISALYPAPSSSDRVFSYAMHGYKLKFGGVSFPPILSDIPEIEYLNDISINVFGLAFNEETKKHYVVGPVFLTKSRKTRHINLLRITKDPVHHYCYIKNLSRLVSKQVSSEDHAIHVCDGCLHYFMTKERLSNHQQQDCSHLSPEIPFGTIITKLYVQRFKIYNGKS